MRWLVATSNKSAHLAKRSGPGAPAVKFKIKFDLSVRLTRPVSNRWVVVNSSRIAKGFSVVATIANRISCYSNGGFSKTK